MFHINHFAFGSIPVEGSSRKTIGGFPIIAIATHSFLLFPPLSFIASTFSYSDRFISTICLETMVSQNYGKTPFIFAYSQRCSHTVRPLKRQSNYGQYPMILLACENSFLLSILSPPMWSSPWEAVTSFVNDLKVVVFPAPFTPSKAKHSPKSTAKETSSTALTILPPVW